MTDVGDFMGAHPVPPPPVKVHRDLALDSFREETSVRARATPTGQRQSGLRLEVAQQPCKAGLCRHPPGTLCGSVDFTPDPSLDEIGVGWTAQHIPGTPDPVDYFCILCWARCDDLALHDCAVVTLVAG